MSRCTEWPTPAAPPQGGEAHVKATAAAEHAAAMKAAKAQKLKAFQTALKARLAEYKRPGPSAAEGPEADVKGIRYVQTAGGPNNRRARVASSESTARAPATERRSTWASTAVATPRSSRAVR